MATWAEFEAEAPDLAAVAELVWPGVVALHRGGSPREGAPTFAIAYIATVQPNGAPRLHPFCPILAGGRLFAAVPPSSPKGHDLRRDPRCAIHAMPGSHDDELCIRATARDVSDDADTRALVVGVVSASGVGGMIDTVSNHPLFEFGLERVDVARWHTIGQSGTYATHARWPAE
jgi:hypothetical protein